MSKLGSKSSFNKMKKLIFWQVH